MRKQNRERKFHVKVCCLFRYCRRCCHCRGERLASDEGGGREQGGNVAVCRSGKGIYRAFRQSAGVYYSLDGHTREIAEKIREKTGADIYEIKTREKFKKTPWFYLTLKKQLKNEEYPELAGELPDPKAYDVVFVGAPVWWYTMATPLFSYLKQTDFGGRIVVPFSTQGSNYGSFFADFVKEAKNAEVDTAAAFNNLPEGYEREVDNKIVSWLNGLSRQ